MAFFSSLVNVWLCRVTQKLPVVSANASTAVMRRGSGFRKSRQAKCRPRASAATSSTCKIPVQRTVTQSAHSTTTTAILSQPARRSPTRAASSMATADIRQNTASECIQKVRV